MIKGLLAALSLFIISACAPSKHAVYLEDQANLKKSCIASAPPSIKKISIDATIRMEPLAGCVAVERGVYEGMPYTRIHPGRSVEFAASDKELPWVVSCGVDSITDKRSSFVRKGALSILSSELGSFVSVQGAAFPGENMDIRVDQNHGFVLAGGQPLKSSSAENLMAQIRKGSTVATRFVEWPTRRIVDGVVDVTGFAQAVSYSESCFR